MSLLDLRGLQVRFGDGPQALLAVDGLDLQVEAGEVLGIVGESGSGKSTMMNVLGCLDSPTTGTYTLDGEAVAGLSEDRLARVLDTAADHRLQSARTPPRLRPRPLRTEPRGQWQRTWAPPPGSAGAQRRAQRQGDGSARGRVRRGASP